MQGLRYCQQIARSHGTGHGQPRSFMDAGTRGIAFTHCNAAIRLAYGVVAALHPAARMKAFLPILRDGLQAMQGCRCIPQGDKQPAAKLFHAMALHAFGSQVRVAGTGAGLVP